MKYLSEMGYVYRLTDKAYLEFVTDRAQGLAMPIELFGKCLGRIRSITDATPSEFELMMDDARFGKKKEGE